MPSTTNRLRTRRTVSTCTPTWAAICALEHRFAAANTILARVTSRTSAVPRRTIASNRPRRRGPNTTRSRLTQRPIIGPSSGVTPETEPIDDDHRDVPRAQDTPMPPAGIRHDRPMPVPGKKLKDRVADALDGHAYTRCPNSKRSPPPGVAPTATSRPGSPQPNPSRSAASNTSATPTTGPSPSTKPAPKPTPTAGYPPVPSPAPPPKPWTPHSVSTSTTPQLGRSNPRRINAALH